jgi:ribose transport system substrate-binding protein
LSNKTSNHLYLIPIMSAALDVLEFLQRENRSLPLEQIYRETGHSRTSVYRILKTFVHRGYVSQSPDGLYRSASRPRKMRFGFAGQSGDQPVSQAVTESLRSAAASSGVDLLVLDNRYDASTALANAEEFIRERVELVIEFQVEDHAAPIIAARLAAAGIPLMAIDIPHPNATYFGVDNYRIGFQGGEILANYAIDRWSKQVDWVLGLDIEEAGTLVQSRTTGAFEAVRTLLPSLPIESFVRMDGRGLRDESHRLVSDFLHRHPHDKHILIAAANDSSALGALEAIRELNRQHDTVIIGHDGIPEMLAELEDPTSPVLASISPDVQQYGPGLIHLGVLLVTGNTVPPYNYIDHKIFSRATIATSAEAVPR